MLPSRVGHNLKGDQRAAPQKQQSPLPSSSSLARSQPAHPPHPTPILHTAITHFHSEICTKQKHFCFFNNKKKGGMECARSSLQKIDGSANHTRLAEFCSLPTTSVTFCFLVAFKFFSLCDGFFEHLRHPPLPSPPAPSLTLQP